jgi:hypothetical protein
MILGANGVALAAAAGVLLTATGCAGAIAYAGWAATDRLWSLRPAAISGGGGIRTRGPRQRTPVFKTGAFDHSATPPGGPS